MNYRFGNMLGVPILQPTFKTPECDDVHDDSELSRLVQLVYKQDERTGIASSDLSVLVSDTVNPQIAEWVRVQLLNPVGFAPSSIKDGQQVDEETLFALVRNHGESRSDYVDRVNNLLREWNKPSEGD